LVLTSSPVPTGPSFALPEIDSEDGPVLISLLFPSSFCGCYFESVNGILSDLDAREHCLWRLSDLASVAGLADLL
jgi:hypothetical protein